MGILMLGLMIPLVTVRGVVSERAARRDAAVAEIGGSWGGAQNLTRRVNWYDLRLGTADKT